MSTKLWWQIASAVMVGILLALMLRYVFVHSLTVLTLFALGLLIAWVMDPVLDAMERKGWKRGTAIWTVTSGVVVVFVSAGVLIVPGIVSQVQDAANNWQNYSATAQSGYDHWRAELETYVDARYPNLEIMPFLDTKVEEAMQWVSQHIPTFLQWVSHQLIASIGLIAAGAMLLIISFHFMNVIDPWRKSLREMLPASTEAAVDKASVQINAMLGQYLRGMVIVSVGSGVAAALLLYIVGIFFGTKYALIIGVITGVTYVIPYLGPLASALSAGFFGYVTCAAGSPWLAAAVSVGAMYAVNQVFDVAITPRVVGQRVGLHPLVILFAVFVAASLFGIPGMIIATPLAASLKIILARWLPIQETDYTAPASKRRLNLDMVASMRLIGHNLQRLGRDLERVVNAEVPSDATEPQELDPEAPAESAVASVTPEVTPAPTRAPAGDESSQKDTDTDNA